MLFLFIFIACLVFQLVLPWWIICPIAMGLAFWKAKTAGNAFFSGFAAVFLLWVIVGLFHSIPNENLLANRIGQLFTLPESQFNWVIILIVTGIIGGLVAGFSALAGFYLRIAFLKPARV